MYGIWIYMRRSFLHFIIFISLLIGFVLGWMVNGWRMSSSYQAEKAEIVQAKADHFADVSRKVNEAATEHVNKTYKLEEKIKELQKELVDAKKNRPVPVECRPDADRLRILAEAVHTANRAAAGQ